MDNRDEEENRPEAGTPNRGNDSTEWADAEQTDSYSAASVPRDDLSETGEMDFDSPLWSDSGADDLSMPADREPTEAPEKDWLVDSGLAAAIRPESAEPESATEDDPDEMSEEDESSWSSPDNDLVGRDEEFEDEDLDEEDLEDDNDLEEDDYEDDDLEDDLDDEEEDVDPEDDGDDGDLDEDDFEDDDEDNSDENDDRLEMPLTAVGTAAPEVATSRSVWPMLVGLVAIVLISVGGWGLFEERGELQARINELERNQSQAKSVSTVDASALSALETDNAALKLQLDGLYRDYELAMAEIARLQEATAMTAPDVADSGVPEQTSETSSPAVAADKTPDAEQESASVPTPGGWFVNVGAFSVAQSAVNLSARLTDSGFDAVVQEMSTDEGRTLFRVRVIGLEAKEDAQQVAQDLESNYGTGPVWIGQNPETQ